jgi:hypothetical protein
MEIEKEKDGITLLVLIITIIFMLIIVRSSCIFIVIR